MSDSRRSGLYLRLLASILRLAARSLPCPSLGLPSSPPLRAASMRARSLLPLPPARGTGDAGLVLACAALRTAASNPIQTGTSTRCAAVQAHPRVAPEQEPFSSATFSRLLPPLSSGLSSSTLFLLLLLLLLFPRLLSSREAITHRHPSLSVPVHNHRELPRSLPPPIHQNGQSWYARCCPSTPHSTRVVPGAKLLYFACLASPNCRADQLRDAVVAGASGGIGQVRSPQLPLYPSSSLSSACSPFSVS